MDLTPDQLPQHLQSQFNEAIVSMEMGDMLTITVTSEKVYDVIRYLHETPDLNFHFLTTMCGLHYPDSNRPFGMMYQLHNMQKNMRIRIKTFTADENPEFVSLTGIWGAANWMEREAYDFFGFRFKGHPDMRRILNMDNMIGWPLRKEFPLEDQARYDKDDKLFGR